jgi:tetratricopeptide (TPR) repeat protein
MHPVVSDVAIVLMQNDISLGDTFYSNIKVTADECSADLSDVLSHVNLFDYIANRTKQYNLASHAIASYYCTDFWGQSTICGNLNRFLSYYQSAIEMTTRLKGDSSQDLVDAYGNAACIYMDLGDYPKAKQYTITALEICHKVFAGEDNAYAAQLYNNLGLIYDKEDDFSNSFQYYEKSLNLHKLLKNGEEDALTATIHHNVACVLRKGNRFEESMYHFQVAMNIWERIYGEGCVQISYVYGGLGELHSITGAYAKAENCILHALMIKKSKLGEENADVADSLCMLGRLYSKQGRIQESVDNLRTALEIRKKVLGDNHAKTLELKALLHTVENQS